MSIVRDLSVLITKRREVHLKDYADLVRQAAGGGVCADDDLIDLIEHTGKSVHDFQTDVETLLSRREAVQGLKDADAMKKDIAAANEVEKKAVDEFDLFEEEYRKKRDELKQRKWDASRQASHVQDQYRKLISDSLDRLGSTVDPALLEEIASAQAELDQAKESFRSVNALMMQNELRDGSPHHNGTQLNPLGIEEEGDNRYSYMRPQWKRQAERRDELQELIPKLEAKLEALEKQKLDPERMRWTEGVE